MNLYKRLRAHWVPSLLLDGVFAAAIFLTISAWQTRNLLPSGPATVAPAISLTALDGQTYTLEQVRGRKVLLYFFAPWCSVCNLSAHNLEALYADAEGTMAVYLIAIGYRSVEAVSDYRKKHNLTMPILLDDGSVARDYNIAATPTYYVLDEAGHVAHKSVGYSTELGMRLRSRYSTMHAPAW